jgi:hypothetical protein
MRFILVCILICCFAYQSVGQKPAILFDKKVRAEVYLPDFSYAGYHNGTKAMQSNGEAAILQVEDFGALPDDGLDDSKALLKVLEAANSTKGAVIVQFPAGRFILSEILYLERSNLTLRGAGSGDKGTVIYCPRPMKYLNDTEPLEELRAYLIELEKRQVEKQNNIDLPFSQYAWSGGMIWSQLKGQRVKSYLERYKQPINQLTTILAGQRGELMIEVESAKNLAVGAVVQLEWFNKEGEEGSLITELYGDFDLKVGGHHWNYPDEPLVKQQVRITQIKGKKVTISSPLLLDIRPQWQPAVTEWKHLEEVAVEHLSMEFPMAPRIAHHVEEGYNGIYLTRVYDGWVKDVVIRNADSGILTEESANLTIQNVETTGERTAHYSVYVGGVHNVLAKNLKVKNKVVHPLSFNTFSTKSVYTGCELLTEPVLDQHSGANHQNLFDNIRVNVSLDGEESYPLFKGGGAGYWKPSHGAFNTFWNIQIDFEDGLASYTKVVLDGMENGPFARIIGVTANRPVEVKYGPDAYVELVNQAMDDIPSLYEYQLKMRKEDGKNKASLKK